MKIKLVNMETPQEEPQRISIKQYNKEIELALEQVKAGNFITQEELEKEMEQW